MRRVTRAQDGFTLIETLVTIFLLVVGVFSAVGVFVDSQKGTTTSQRLDAAVAVGTAELERMRRLPYGQVALAACGNEPPMTTGDPRSRVSNGKLQPNGTGMVAEPLVPNTAAPSPLPAAGERDTCTYDERQIPYGSGTVRARIYRFVSWRNEECPIVDLAQLKTALTDLRATIQALAGPTGVLTNLAKNGGSLKVAQSNVAALKGNALLYALLTLTYKTQLDRVVPALGPLDDALSPLNSSLQPLLTDLNGLGSTLDQLTGVLDLCDLPPGIVPDLSKIAVLNAALNSIAPALNALGPAVSDVVSSTDPNLLAAVLNSLTAVLKGGVDVAVANSVAAINQTLSSNATTLAELKDTADAVRQSLSGVQQLIAKPDTVENTKRISIAVWLDPPHRGNEGPGKPVWLSTVVINPEDGLL